jgi:Dihydrodipicolinate synthetase family
MADIVKGHIRMPARSILKVEMKHPRPAVREASENTINIARRGSIWLQESIAIPFVIFLIHSSAIMSSEVPRAGVWCPAVTLFDPNTDKVDFENQSRYFYYLSTTGLAGLVILGTNAETMLLTREERKTLIATARRAVGPSFPIMAGVGSHSTAQTLEFISDAATAGADSVLVLPCCYFGM